MEYKRKKVEEVQVDETWAMIQLKELVGCLGESGQIKKAKMRVSAQSKVQRHVQSITVSLDHFFALVQVQPVGTFMKNVQAFDILQQSCDSLQVGQWSAKTACLCCICAIPL
jgi:hypothetical protein